MRTKLICEHAAGWLDALQGEIASLKANQPNIHIFALLDCAFVEHIDTVIQAQALPFRSLFDLSANPARALQAVSPTLVPLTPEAAARWREVLCLTEGWPMLSLIVTPESIDELARRLEPWCIVNADGQPFVFRFPDTRRLPAIIHALTPEQHGALFGPILTWRYRARTGDWAELPLPPAPLPVAEYVKLNAEQCAQLIDDSEADAIIADLEVNEPAVLRPHDPATSHKLVTYGLKRADRYGILDTDRIEWCHLILQQPQLEQRAQAIPLLASLLSKKCSYAEIENDLKRIAHMQEA